MKKSALLVLLTVIVLLIGGIVLYDRLTGKREALPENAFVYSVDAYATVADSLISYQEVKQIHLKQGRPMAIEYAKGLLYILIDNTLQIIDKKGIVVSQYTLSETPYCLTVVDDVGIVVAFEQTLGLYGFDGKVIRRSNVTFEEARFTALDADKERLYVADAAGKRVLVFDHALRFMRAFEGESGVSDQHGFIVPSLHFDLCVNSDDELWVVNPGLHALQNYTAEGRLRGYWSKTSFTIEGFSGCCNPFHIAFLTDGRLVTSEKGLVRIKVHQPSGVFESVVAPPAVFGTGKRAPDITVDEANTVIALDFDGAVIRYFTPKQP